MKTKTESILQAMNVLTWVVFIGLLVQTGAYIVTYSISALFPSVAKNLYLGLDLLALRELSFSHYTLTLFLIIFILGLKAYTAYLVVKILSKINLEQPFTQNMASLIKKVSIAVFIIWIVAMFSNAHHKWMHQNGLPIPENWISGEFIFLAGVIFIIAQIFKKRNRTSI